jgi:hypothetical protein
MFRRGAWEKPARHGGFFLRPGRASIPQFTCVGGANGAKALKRHLNQAWCSNQLRTAIIN